mmetsp:Transcript_53608/g.149131  ORF Transcript_53608/g.149131 Transcript_53608/m.149131 type:complete len:630 (+) Transcript_53608:75-1964(+)
MALFGLKVGPYECVCVVDDADRREEISTVDSAGSSKLQENGIARTPGAEQIYHADEGQPPKHNAERCDDVHIPSRQKTRMKTYRRTDTEEGDRGTWKPLLPRSFFMSRTSSDPETALAPDWWDLPFAPVPRKRAGPTRQRSRDAWNFDELRLGNTLARGEFQCAEGLDENDLHAVLTECFGDELEERDFSWTLHLAMRAEPSRPVSLQELHYAIRAWHGLRSLPKEAMRKLAQAELKPAGSTPGLDFEICLAKLGAVLEELNEGVPILDVEVQLVADEAEAIGDGKGGRAAVLRAVGAWYSNVQRRDTPWVSLFHAWFGRWAGTSDYHAEVLYQLARFAPEQVEQPVAMDSDSMFLRGDTPRRRASTSLDRNLMADVASGALDRDSATPLERVLRVSSAVVVATVLLSMLVLPTIFFAWLIYVGATHGGDQCPQDLDGLLCWFGVLGIAALAVDCAEGSIMPGRRRSFKASGETFGWTGFGVRLVLLAFPWFGTAWSFRLTSPEQVLCGRFLWVTSALLWPLLLLLELVVAFAFCWGLAVLCEHEISLRQVLAAPEPAPQNTPMAAMRSGASPSSMRPHASRHGKSPASSMAQTINDHAPVEDGASRDSTEAAWPPQDFGVVAPSDDRA